MTEIVLEATGFWGALAISLWLGFLIFRDVADITQFWFKCERKTVMQTWYRRHVYVGVSLLLLLGAFYLNYGHGVGVESVAILSASVWGVFILGGYFNPGWMMRTQQRTGRFVSVDEAKCLGL